MYGTYLLNYVTSALMHSYPDYELVRIYHPDSPISQATDVSPDIAEDRFHSITAAYDILRGKRPFEGGSDEPQSRGRHAEAAMVKARMVARARRAEFLETGGDERWKEWIFVGAIVLVRPLFSDSLFHFTRTTDRSRFRSAEFLDQTESNCGSQVSPTIGSSQV
jgi:curved DNA-binding protein CbpA